MDYIREELLRQQEALTALLLGQQNTPRQEEPAAMQSGQRRTVRQAEIAGSGQTALPMDYEEVQLQQRALAAAAGEDRLSRVGERRMVDPLAASLNGMAVRETYRHTGTKSREAEDLSRVFQRDARRYDGGFTLY